MQNEMLCVEWHFHIIASYYVKTARTIINLWKRALGKGLLCTMSILNSWLSEKNTVTVRYVPWYIHVYAL